MKRKKRFHKLKTDERPRGELQTFKVRCSLETVFYALVEAHNTEVMAWSNNTERGVLTPDRFRVTLNMITKAMEDNADADV